MEQGYNNAKYWQIGFFSLNNAATNLYLALMGYVSYYANSMAGFGIVLISAILTALNIFDAVTDPILAFIYDKVNTPFGKVRVLLASGWLVMVLATLLMYSWAAGKGHGFVVIMNRVFTTFPSGGSSCTARARARTRRGSSRQPWI